MLSVLCSGNAPAPVLGDGLPPDGEVGAFLAVNAGELHPPVHLALWQAFFSTLEFTTLRALRQFAGNETEGIPPTVLAR